MFIPDPGPLLWIFSHPGSGSRIQGPKKHRIPDPGPQQRVFTVLYCIKQQKSVKRLKND
jgi:hypothetical protein